MKVNELMNGLNKEVPNLSYMQLTAHEAYGDFYFTFISGEYGDKRAMFCIHQDKGGNVQFVSPQRGGSFGHGSQLRQYSEQFDKIEQHFKNAGIIFM
jgi:hypothetical protein